MVDFISRTASTQVNFLHQIIIIEKSNHLPYAYININQQQSRAQDANLETKAKGLSTGHSNS